MNTNHSSVTEAEELNFQQLLGTLRRRWPLVLAGIVLGGLTAVITTSRDKKTWEGSFEIVLASDNGIGRLSSSLGSSPTLSSLAALSGKGGRDSALQTQVRILQSPSVLKPVFQEVLAKKATLGDDTSSYRFKSFSKSLRIEVAKGTTILSIAFQSTNPRLIIPALNYLSDAYQAYSTRERNQSLNSAIAYADEQSKIYRKKSELSSRALNAYNLTYGITSSGEIGSGIGGSRSKTEELLKSVLNSSGSQVVQNMSGTDSDAKPSGNPLAQLSQLNLELIRLQQSFTDKDPKVIALKRERDALRRHIETSAVGLIAYPGKTPLSKEQAQNIILRHKELESIASRDRNTLESMENSLLSLRLEKARSVKPWQMISTPTLLEYPVAPRPVRNLAIGIASGLIIGCVGAAVAELRTGKVFNKELIKELLPAELLLDLSSNEPDKWNDGLRLLALNNMLNSSTAILPLGDINPISSERIREVLMQTCKGNIQICETTLEAATFENQLLLIGPGSICKANLDRIVQELKLQNTPILGWIWLDSKLSDA